VELGRVPVASELGDEREVAEGWRLLHEAHALVLEPDSSVIRMANPFSAVPTAHRVYAQERWWYANCAWDAFGICAALGDDRRVESVCPDCGEPYAVEVRESRIDRPDLLFHALVPAAQWWDDIVFT